MNKINMNRKGTKCNDLDWTQLAQDSVQWSALMNMLINLWVP